MFKGENNKEISKSKGTTHWMVRDLELDWSRTNYQHFNTKYLSFFNRKIAFISFQRAIIANKITLILITTNNNWILMKKLKFKENISI